MPAEESCKRELDISVPWDQVEQEIEQVAQAYGRKARIPGFRPGKAPPTVVRTRFWNDIKQDVIERLVPKAFWQQAESQKLHVVGAPDVREMHFENGAPLKFHAEFEVVPEFDLADYRRIEVPYREPEVTEEDIQKELDHLREQHASFQNVDARPLEDGDIAVVSLKSAEVPDAPKVDQDEVTLTIGDHDTLQDFTDNLRGKSPGDELDFEVHYPEDFANEKMAGKTIPFHAAVKGIRRKELPALDDDFAADAGNFQTLDELRKQIHEAMLSHRRRLATEAAKDKLVDALLSKHDFPAPAKLVERQIATRAERQLRALARQGIDPSKLDIDWTKIREAEHEGAARDVRAGLLLERIADVEKIEVTSAEIDEQIKRYAAQSKKPVAAARAKLAEDGTLDRMHAHIRNEKTLNFLFDEAQKVDQEVEAG